MDSAEIITKDQTKTTQTHVTSGSIEKPSNQRAKNHLNTIESRITSILKPLVQKFETSGVSKELTTKTSDCQTNGASKQLSPKSWISAPWNFNAPEIQNKWTWHQSTFEPIESHTFFLYYRFVFLVETLATASCGRYVVIDLLWTTPTNHFGETGVKRSAHNRKIAYFMSPKKVNLHRTSPPRASRVELSTPIIHTLKL